MSAIGDPQLIRLINQGVVYRMLRAKPGMSRAQLSQSTGLTKSTISLLVKELIEERWLVESEIFSRNSMGRPSTSIFVDVQSRTLIGLEFNSRHIQLVATSTAGEVRFAQRLDHGSRDVDSLLTHMAALLSDASDRVQASGMLLGGIGVTFAGVYEEGTGMLRSAMEFPWKDVPILLKLRSAFKRVGLSDVPLFVHSRNHCCAVGAYEFSEQQADTLMYLDFSSAIQMGIVVGDRICAGMSGTAGNIGHSLIQSDGPLCTVCGRNSCVHAWLAMAELDQLADSSVRAPVLADLLLNLYKAFNPSVMVIGGESVARWPALFDKARQMLLQAHQQEADVPSLQLCRHGPMSAAIGAAALPHYYRLRPLESPAIAISRALDFASERMLRASAHGHVSWN